MSDRPVGEDVDESWHLAVDSIPVLDSGPFESCGKGDGRQVQQQVGRATAGGVEHQGIFDGVVGKDVGYCDPGIGQSDQCPGTADCVVEPDGLSGGCECGVRQAESECFGDDL